MNLRDTTSGSRHRFDRVITSSTPSAHSLVDRFDAIVAHRRLRRRKPAPPIRFFPLLRAAELLAVAPGRSSAIEDSHNGVHHPPAA